MNPENDDDIPELTNEEHSHSLEKLGKTALPAVTHESVTLLEERVARLTEELAALVSHNEATEPLDIPGHDYIGTTRSELALAKQQLDEARTRLTGLN